jgi:hypothetical protein
MPQRGKTSLAERQNVKGTVTPGGRDRMMFLSTVVHIPEIVTGLIGAGLIVTAFVDSIRYNRRICASDSVARPVCRS